MIQGLKTKIENLEIQNDMGKPDPFDTNSIYIKYLENVDEIKKAITKQHHKMSEAEELYNENLNQLKNMNKILIDLGELKYKTQNEDILKTENEFNTSLERYVSNIQDDNQLDILHENYKQELKLFQKYISIGALLSEVQQIPICILCMENVPLYTFQCGHVCCEKCIQKVEKSGKCHTCRGPVNNKIKLFLFN